MAPKVQICSEDEAFHILDQLLLVFNADPLIDEVAFIHPSQLSSLKQEEEESSGTSSSGRQERDDKPSSMPSETVALEDSNAYIWSREHKLGISTAYLLPLYKAAKTRFMDTYVSYKMKSSYSEKNECFQWPVTEIEDELMNYSKVLLLLSSDFGTAWNARKLIISKRVDFSVSDELYLSTLVLSFAPKSENAWSYRRWVINEIAGRGATLEDLLQKESEIAEKFAEKSKMNYRAWNHRRWLIPFMKSQQILHELNTNRTWALSHVADSSCFHYRRRLMLQMLSVAPQNDIKACSYPFDSLQHLWKDELNWNESLIRRYIGREALWLHRRFLSVCWWKHFGDQDHGTSQQPSEKSHKFRHAPSFIDNELGLLRDCINLPESVFDDTQSQAIHSAAYILWLSRETTPPISIDLHVKLGAGDLRTLLNKLCPEKSEVWNCLLGENIFLGKS